MPEHADDPTLASRATSPSELRDQLDAFEPGDVIRLVGIADGKGTSERLEIVDADETAAVVVENPSGAVFDVGLDPDGGVRTDGREVGGDLHADRINLVEPADPNQDDVLRSQFGVGEFDVDEGCVDAGEEHSTRDVEQGDTEAPNHSTADVQHDEDEDMLDEDLYELKAERLAASTSLSGRQAEVVAAKMQGLSHAEIAELLDVSKGVVDKHSTRARKKVQEARALLEAIGDVYPEDE